MQKYAAVDSCVSIGVPGNMIPSWFKEQQDGCRIALKLPPSWQPQIMGFAISVVFSPKRQFHINPYTNIRFEDDGMLVTETNIDCINACSRSEGIQSNPNPPQIPSIPNSTTAHQGAYEWRWWSGL